MIRTVWFLNNASWASFHFRLYSRIFILRHLKSEYWFLHLSRGHTELKHGRCGSVPVSFKIINCVEVY
jgi:hypothetical protein